MWKLKQSVKNQSEYFLPDISASSAPDPGSEVQRKFTGKVAGGAEGCQEGCRVWSWRL